MKAGKGIGNIFIKLLRIIFHLIVLGLYAVTKLSAVVLEHLSMIFKSLASKKW